MKDTREVRLDAGLLDVQFGDVAAQIDPTTVHLKSLTDPPGLKILEQNYEYDLLTTAKLMEKYVGKHVRLYQSNGMFQLATLLSITLRNHKHEPITVDVFEPMPGDWEVLRATHPHEKVQAFTAKWSLPIPKDGETKLTYRVRVRW